MPEGGQVLLHPGVAVKVRVPPGATDCVVGLKDNDVRVDVEDLTVITVELFSTVPLSVALTKIPTVPAVVPAVNVVEMPVAGVIEPKAELVRAHA
jgi:hypothetical protein